MRFPTRWFLALSLSFAAPALAVEVETARGPVEAPDAPQTVVAFDPAAIDTLSALGVPLAGVPSPLHLPRLAGELEGVERVGTLFEPDLEAVAALGPDLAIVGARSAAAMEGLSDLAPTLDMSIDGGALVEDAFARLAAYGAIFGRGEEAEALAHDLRARIDEARAAAQGQGTALILLTNGPKISAYGPGSRFGWIHETLSLPPAVEGLDVATHGQAVSFEFVMQADPDWLLVVDRGAVVDSVGAGARATLDNELVARTTAWKTGQVIYLDAAEIYVAGGGVGAMRATLDQLIARFGADG